MANRIRIKRSSVPGKVPTASDLEVGELAVNTADGVLYTKHTSNAIVTISSAETGYTGSLGDTGYTGSQGTIGYTGSFPDLENYSGNIIPSADKVYSIGSPTNRWKNVFVGAKTIYLDEFGLSANVDGLIFDGNLIGWGYTGSLGYTGSAGTIGYSGSIGYTGSVGPGVPSGGLVGEYLVKNSLTDYDLVWIDRVQASVIKETVKNVSGNVIAKGTPVYQIGTQGNTITVAPADAGNPAKMPCIGVLGEEIADEAEGAMFVLGEIKGVNTSSFNSGDKVYVAVGGGYTNVQPTDANVTVQFLGIVNRIGINNGSGYITGTLVPDVFRYNTTATSFQGWSGSNWVNISTVGYTGSQGDLGYTGSQGETGYTGLQGIIGYTGSFGYTGSQGEFGYTGSQGDQGYSGSQGTTGYSGSRGIIGYSGSQGEQGNTGYAGSQGDMGYSGSQGVIGYSGSQGDAGYTGSQGDQGYTGSQGVLGYTGSQGNQGYTGSQGLTGYTGSQGDIGYTGSQGSTGYTGSQGELGYTGSQGVIGASGLDGDRYHTTSTDSLTLANSGQVYFTTSDLGLDYSVAQTVIIANNLSNYMRGQVVSYDPITGNLVVDLNSSIGSGTYDSWNINLDGAVGAIGYTGSLGNTGATGYTGSQGEFGYTGSQGTTGYAGSQGTIGYSGSQGETGEIGYSGSQGDQGYTGSQGVLGYTGSFGDTGYVGSQGDTGYTGSQGVIGYSGSQGIQGEIGPIGYTGSQGDLGYTGSQGALGYTGSQGETGYTGSRGETGYTGSLGFTGSLGYTGSTGSVIAANSNIYNGNVEITDAATLVDSLPTTGNSSVRWLLTSIDNTNQIRTYSTIDSINDGVNIYYNEYAVLTSNLGLYAATFTCNISGGSQNLYATGNSSNVSIQYQRISLGTGTQLGYVNGVIGIGYTGSRGQDGIIGVDGYTGSGGYNGSSGYTGSIGYTGSLGYTGSFGTTGYTGSRGYTGSIGYSGSAGYTGSLGSLGYSGSIGYSGSSGTVLPLVRTMNYTGSLLVYNGTKRWWINSSYTLTKLLAYLTTAPSGSAANIRLNKNGSPVANLSISSGTTSTTSNVSIAVVQGDYMTVDITAIGSTTPGADMSLMLEYRNT